MDTRRIPAPLLAEYGAWVEANTSLEALCEDGLSELKTIIRLHFIIIANTESM